MGRVRRTAAFAVALTASLLPARADDAPEPPAAEVILEPNAEDADGTPAFEHVTPADMPLRVAVNYPKEPARYAGIKQTRTSCAS